MAKILHIITSPRGEQSNSIKLGDAIIDRLREKDPGAKVVIKNLATNPLPHLEESHLNAFGNHTENHTEADKVAISHSNQAISELMDADIIVIGAPMYNFTLASTLKSWIDHIARAGLTFKYTAHGPEGLVLGKKVYLAVATGGVYSTGDYQAVDFLSPYLKFFLAFIGIDDVTIIRAEGFAVAALKETALDVAIDGIKIQ